MRDSFWGKNKKSLILFAGAFVLLAFVPFCWSVASGGFQCIGGGDYFSVLNAKTRLLSLWFPYNHFSYAGWFDGAAISSIPLYSLLYLIELAGGSPLVRTLLFLGMLIFFSQLSFYRYLNYFIEEKLGLENRYKSICFAGAVMYGFSPYMAALIVPGHFFNLIVYAAFPVFIKHLDIMMDDGKTHYRSAVVLFLFCILCAPGLNIATIYVVLIASLIYCLSVFLIYPKEVYSLCFGFCLFSATLILSNTWYLLPYLSNIRHLIRISQATASTITANIHQASSHASLLNVFMGKPQGMLYMDEIVGNTYYVAGPVLWIFWAILFFCLATLFFKKKYLHVLLISLLASAFFVKGPQPPMGSLFMWAFDHIPGFRILRRPDAKFYGFFLFFFWTAAIGGYVLVTKRWGGSKIRKACFSFAGISAAAYLVFIFSMLKGLVPFNIPEMYTRVNASLLADDVRRLLILPSTYGLNPVYTKQLNSYNGIDFINEVFQFPMIFPDGSDYSANELYKRPTNELMQLIRQKDPICKAVGELGISHIMVRKDLDPNQRFEDNPDRLITILDSHPDIKTKTIFEGAGRLIVYKIKDKCRRDLLSAASAYGNDRFSLGGRQINPTKIHLQFRHLKTPVRLTFLENYSENWKLYASAPLKPVLEEREGRGVREAGATGTVSVDWPSVITDWLYLFRSQAFENTHRMVAGYANQWQIDPGRIKTESKPGLTRNDDGSVTLDFVLFYQSQAYLFPGFVISVLFFCLISGMMVKEKRRETLKLKSANQNKRSDK